MGLLATIKGHITVTFEGGRTVSGSASITGTTTLEKMSNAQLQALKGALLKILLDTVTGLGGPNFGSQDAVMFDVQFKRSFE